MKIFVATILGMALFLCGPRIKLLDATSQKWMGGRPESGKGTDYIITLKARGGSDKLVIDKLWVGDDLYEVNAVRDLARRSDPEFARNDTVFVRAGLKFKPNDMGQLIQVTGEKTEPPIVYEGEALLSYTWKGKRKYLEIDEFRVLKKIIYP